LIVAAALLLCLGRRTYPRDVATAMACELLTAEQAARRPSRKRGLAQSAR
jgi:hypothetical protein